MTTGIFFTNIFKTSPGPVVGPKFVNFPELLEEVLRLENVELFEHRPVSDEVLLRFHSPDMIESLKARNYAINAFSYLTIKDLK